MLGLGSTSQLGIGIAIQLNDQFSGKAKAINSQLLAMKQNSMSALTGAIQNYRNQAAAIAGGATLVSAGMFSMVKAAADYDHLINQIAIVGGKQLGQSRADLDKFARSMSAIFPNSPNEVAQAMFENVKAGVTKGLDQITKYQIAVSTATNELIGGEQGVAQGLLGIMNAMDLTVDQFPRVASATAQAANVSMASVFSINESMQYFANTAHAANLNLEETLALIAKLSQSNIKGSIAGTALSNMIRHLVQAAGPMAGPKAMKAWSMLGVDKSQVAGLINQAKIFEIITLMDKASKKLDYVTKENVFNQIFGVRGEKALINLFGSSDPTKTFAALRDAIKAGVKEDVAMKQAKAMSNDPWADIRKMGNAMARFGIQFLNAARPTIRVLFGIIEKVVSFANFLLSTPVGKVLAGLVIVVTPLIAVMFALRAAALTAAIALRGFAGASSVGGFGGLLQGALGMAGMGRFGKFGGAVARNAAGRYMVAAGKTVEFGGKVFKGGQLLPGTFLSSIGIASTFAKSGAGFFTRALPWITKIGGYALRALPYVGWGLIAVDLLRGIFNLQKKEVEQKLDPLFLSYYKNLDAQLMGMTQKDDFYNKYAMSYNDYKRMGQTPVLNQNLNISLDNTQVYNKMLQMQADQSLNNSLHFEMPDGFE